MSPRAFLVVDRVIFLASNVGMGIFDERFENARVDMVSVNKLFSVIIGVSWMMSSKN